MKAQTSVSILRCGNYIFWFYVIFNRTRPNQTSREIRSCSAPANWQKVAFPLLIVDASKMSRRLKGLCAQLTGYFVGFNWKQARPAHLKPTDRFWHRYPQKFGFNPKISQSASASLRSTLDWVSASAWSLRLSG